jgi:hypothetical protein
MKKRRQERVAGEYREGGEGIREEPAEAARSGV